MLTCYAAVPLELKIGRNLTKFGICGKIFDEMCTFGRTKNGILAAKSFGAYLWSIVCCVASRQQHHTVIRRSTVCHRSLTRPHSTVDISSTSTVRSALGRSRTLCTTTSAKPPPRSTPRQVSFACQLVAATPVCSLPFLTLPSGWAGCYTCPVLDRISSAQCATPM